MGLQWNLFLFGCLGFVALSVKELAAIFMPASCTQPPCIEPLFRSDQLVDLYLYTSTNRKIADPATKSLEANGMVLLYNRTGVSTRAAFNETLQVPLPPSVRSNGSLYAHLIVVRAGLSPEPSKHKKYEDRRNEAWRRRDLPAVRYRDLLYASAPMTRHMVPLRRNRTNLLRDMVSKSTELPPGSFRVSLPMGQTLTIHPLGLMGWAGLIFLGTGFWTPSPVLAAVRLGLAASIPYLYSLSQLNDQYKQQVAQRALATIIAGEAPQPACTHWKPRLTLRYGYDDNHYPADDFAPKLYDKYVFKPGAAFPNNMKQHQVRYSTWGGDKYDAEYRAKQKGGDGTLGYAPPVYVEDNTMQYEYSALSTNASRAHPYILFEFAPLSRPHYQVLMMVSETTKIYMHFGASEGDVDEFKYMMTAGLWRMAVMQVIGFLQLTLSGLAFKNDIAFFKGREDFSGLSSRSLITDFSISLIIFLYLCDNEFTSRIVLYPMGVGVLIDAWKVKRRMHMHILWSYLLPWVGYKTDKVSAEEKTTEEIDAKGMRYLAMVLYPVVAALAVYSLYFNHYKSWWSWLISSLADASYTFGFINMFPQIFINYKLKSVAHMPWRVMTYKAFNTFVDDAVAFGGLFPMPMKHRLMTLRDDIVFLIFLYQRYIYPIDKKRADEYGFVHADDDEGAKHARAIGAAKTADALKADVDTMRAENEAIKSYLQEVREAKTDELLGEGEGEGAGAGGGSDEQGQQEGGGDSVASFFKRVEDDVPSPEPAGRAAKEESKKTK